MKLYPYERGGDIESFEVVLARELEVLAILKGLGHIKFPPFKGGGGTQKLVPCHEGEGCKMFQTRYFPRLYVLFSIGNVHGVLH